MSGKPIRALSDAQVAAVLEALEQLRDELEVEWPPASEGLLDEIRDTGLVGPDLQFLAKRIGLCKEPEEAGDAFRRAMLELLRSRQRHHKVTLNLVAGELERLWWPTPEAEKAENRRLRSIRAKTKRAWVQIMEAILRRKGVKHSRSTAWEVMARAFGHSSGAALRRDLQASRVNPRPRRKPRG